MYLELPADPVKRPGIRSGIFVREDGRTIELTRAEWNARFPDREPVIVAPAPDDDLEVYQANITHNLTTMARHAGLYEPLWRPLESGYTQAFQLIPSLRDGLAELQTFPDKYREFNPENGWGSYEALVGFVAEYLAACERWPEARVSTWV